MEKTSWVKILPWILLTEAVGVLAGWLTRDSMELYTMQIVQPPLSPPGIVFPIVWTLLYGLMGIGAGRITQAEPGSKRNRALNVFIAQLIVNFFWSLFFFRAQAFGFSFLWILLLWALIVVLILSFRQIDRTAAALQIPYLLWVTFAAYLNLGVWLLNPA